MVAKKHGISVDTMIFSTSSKRLYMYNVQCKAYMVYHVHLYVMDLFTLAPCRSIDTVYASVRRLGHLQYDVIIFYWIYQFLKSNIIGQYTQYIIFIII